MKKNKFLLNALILSGTSLFLNTVIISFKVYIAGKIGAEGMGLYQLIISIYIFGATFATSGISLTVTRLVSEAIAKGEEDKTSSIMRRCFLFSSGLGCIAGVLLLFGSDFIGSYLLTNSETVPSLKILAISLPFMSLSSCFSGFFLAIRKVYKSAIIQILEEFMQIVITIIFLNHYLPMGYAAACMAVVIGVSASEVLSSICAFTLYIFEKKAKPKKSTQTKGIFKNILNITMPLAISSYMRSALTSLENLLIPISLKKAGNSSSEALSMFGLLKGMVFPVLFFPAVFISAFSRLIMPEFADARAVGNTEKINIIGAKVVQLSLVFSILVTGIFIIFSNELGLLIFKSQKASEMLFVLAPLVPLMYLDGIVDGMLKGLNEQVVVMKYNIIEAALRVGLVFFIIPIMGFNGFMLTVYVGNMLNSMMSLNKFIKITDIKFPFSLWIIRPLISVFAAGLPVFVIFKYFIKIEFPTVFCIIMTILLYVLFIFLTGCLKRDDAVWILDKVGLAMFIKSDKLSVKSFLNNDRTLNKKETS